MEPALPPARRGVSTGVILLVAAALGLVGGVVLAEVRLMGDAVPAEDDEPLIGEADEAMPMGRAMAQADPMAPDEETLEGIAPYPGAAPRKLTSHSSVSGMPMKVSWFSTPDGPGEVLAFYQKAFVADDRRVVTHRFSENIGYVAWTDRNDPPPHGDAGEDDPTPPNPLHMVSVVRQGRDTLVFISKTEPHEFFARPLRLPNVAFSRGADAIFVGGADGVLRRASPVEVRSSRTRPSQPGSSRHPVESSMTSG